ncbi:MAG: FxsA family protein [Acidimicrobiales bacterium]|nr:FxsA family protein [Acidimicrobiales bacterium]
MGLVLLLLFLAVPIVELAVIVQVADEIGVAPTLALLLLVSLTGAWLVKREGFGVWRRMNEAVAAGRVPGAELIDAFVLLLAGGLLLVPGFVTDALGLVLLLPPVRAVVRRLLGVRLFRRTRLVTAQVWGAGRTRAGIVDVDEAGAVPTRELGR